MQLLPRGLFVTLEGGDGSGKSTLAQGLGHWLRAQGFDVCLTREPAGTPLGTSIWSLFEKGRTAKTHNISPMAELFLMEAARAEHVEEVIRPALERGEVVICDRFFDSTTAYQGYGRGIDLELVRAMNDIATSGLEPDLTLLLDVPSGEGVSRAGHPQDGKKGDSIGGEALAFHERVRQGFLAIAAAEPDRIVVLDAGEPAQAVLKVAEAQLEMALEGAVSGL